MDSVEALTDEGRPSQFLAIGQEAFTLEKANMGQGSCIQASQPTNLLLPHACTKNYDVLRRDRPIAQSTPFPHNLPHHASEGQGREPRPCKRSGRHVRKLFTGGTARRSKAISPYLPPPPPRALGKGESPLYRTTTVFGTINRKQGGRGTKGPVLVGRVWPNSSPLTPCPGPQSVQASPTPAG